MNLEELKERLRKKATTSSVPPKLSLKENEEFFGLITRIIKNPWNESQNFYIVVDLSDGAEYRLPNNVIIINRLGAENAGPGDLVYIKFLGQRKSQRGRTVNAYEIAVDKIDDATLISLCQRLNILPPRSVAFPRAPWQEVSQQGAEKTTRSQKQQKENADFAAAVEAVKQLFQYFPDISREELEHYFYSVRKFTVDLDEVLKTLGKKVK